MVEDYKDNYITGWIKIYRSLMNKAYYKKDSEKVHLWIHLIMKATHDGKEEILGGKPIICKPGQFTTGRNQLVLETGINRSKIERILTYFEKIEHQIEQQTTNTNRLISILNWHLYQNSKQQIEQQVSNERATSEQQVSTLQECKEYKEIHTPVFSIQKINDWYQNEIEKNLEKKEIENYKQLTEFLTGKNELQTSFECWLKLRDQLTYEQFEKIIKKAREKNRKIRDMIISGYNNPKKYLKGNVSIYATLNSWLNR